MQMQFIRDWAASCVDQNLPPYDAQEIGPAIRKCDTERHVVDRVGLRRISAFCPEDSPTMQLILLIFSVFLLPAVDASLQCFNVHPSHAVSNSDPIVELFDVTAGECLNYCISNAASMGDGCSSVVFHRKHNTCQLYGHDGSFNGAQVVFIETHDFYIRSSWEGTCQDKTSPKRGYKQRPKQFSSPTFGQFENPLAISKNFQAQNNSIDLQLVPNFTENQFPTKNGESIPEPQPASLEAPEKTDKTAFRNPTHENQCSKNEKVSYFVLEGYRLSSDATPQLLNGVDQSSCIMYCSQNINAIGNVIPCYSVNFEPTNEVCKLYGKQQRELQSWAQVERDEEYTFADKFCLQTKKDCASESTYIVHLYKQMHKKIISYIPGLNSKVACLSECIDDINCMAVTYKPGLCILHSESPSTDSTVLVDGSEETMVIENGCQAFSAPPPPADIEESAEGGQWQEWSLCQYGVKNKRMRVRQRDCDDCEENLQMERC
ncbi:unnamed protein product [Caenorhabditis auriculariae]|uniref:Apple domain-containing protein n=1 Tax=Caenorhabditis auriculariae TaxID=2777116 RepID=A0A8S1GXD4_9PELO|nr:unnamed protein product [Caenorhabditis auriculariae]